MEAGPGPRRHLKMGDAGGPSESSGGDGSGKDLPVMPGPEKPLLHLAIEFVEMLDNALAEHQMLNIAHGEMPAEAARDSLLTLQRDSRDRAGCWNGSTRC